MTFKNFKSYGFSFCCNNTSNNNNNNNNNKYIQKEKVKKRKDNYFKNTYRYTSTCNGNILMLQEMLNFC